MNGESSSRPKPIPRSKKSVENAQNPARQTFRPRHTKKQPTDQKPTNKKPLTKQPSTLNSIFSTSLKRNGRRPDSESAHATFFADHDETGRMLVYKSNKHGNPELSRLEVSISKVARLFLDPGLTPHYRLVYSSDHPNQIVGVTCDHLSHTVLKGKVCVTIYSLDIVDGNLVYKEKEFNHDNKKDLPIYFFDHLPEAILQRLMDAEQKKELTIDYASLASILTTADTLEEDDLHKANLGLYLIKKEGKPHVVFINIDHDLKLMNKIMSYGFSRIQKWFNGKGAMKTTTRGLKQNPELTDSDNFYHPSKVRLTARPFSTKKYSYSDTQAIIKLAKHSLYIVEKWKSYFKHIIITESLIDEVDKPSQLEGLELNDFSKERAISALVSNATISNQSRKRTELLSISEFRQIISNLDQNSEEQIIDKIMESASVANPVSYRAGIKVMIDACKLFCSYDPNTPEEGDTPLHTAIKSDAFFKYTNDTKDYLQYLNVPNSLGVKPLDLALEKAKYGDKTAQFIVWSLEQQGAVKGDTKVHLKTIDDQDTPLHIAIKLGDFRYHDDWHEYLPHLNTPNSKGYTPLDLALELATRQPDGVQDIRQDAKYTAVFLLEHKAKLNFFADGMKEKIEQLKQYHPKISYETRVQTVNHYSDFKMLLRDLGEDHQFSLKMKKEISVVCFKRFIENYKGKDLDCILKDFRADLNGEGKEKPPAPEFSFIRQLRSSLWIIRKIRGLYGRTSTKVELNGLIDKTIQQLKPKSPGCLSFLYSPKPEHHQPTGLDTSPILSNP